MNAVLTNSPKQYSILINYNDLRETDLLKISRRVALIGQTVIVHRVPCGT